jgi:hypothetical protein
MVPILPEINQFCVDEIQTIKLGAKIRNKFVTQQGKVNKEIAEAIGANQSIVWRERYRSSLKRRGYLSDNISLKILSFLP